MKQRKFFQLTRAVQDNRKTHLKNKIKQIEENLLNSHKEERIQEEFYQQNIISPRHELLGTPSLRLHRASRVESSRVKSFDAIHFDVSPFTPTALTRDKSLHTTQ